MCLEIAGQLFTSSCWFQIISWSQLPVFILQEENRACVWHGHFPAAAKFSLLAPRLNLIPCPAVIIKWMQVPQSNIAYCTMPEVPTHEERTFSKQLHQLSSASKMSWSATGNMYFFCSRNSSISQSPRELVSKNKSHRHVYKLTGNKHSNFGYRNWSKFCLTVYLNHLQSGLL